MNSAQRDADRARVDALRARAAERAVPELQRADNTLRESAQLRQRNRPMDAARTYWRAQDRVRGSRPPRGDAPGDAADGYAPVEHAGEQSAAALQPPPPRDAAESAGDAACGSATRASEARTAARATRTAAAAETREPQPPAQADNRGAIQQALNRYAAAHASLSAAQVASIWRTMNAQQIRSLDNGFREQNSHTVSLSNCSIKDSGDRGTAQCMLRRQISFKNGQRFDRSNAATFELEKRGNDWVITEVTVR